MSKTRNIVFLGASYAGTNSAHYFLRHVYPKLPQEKDIVYRVVIVDPSEKIFLRPAVPRGLVSSELMPDEALFLDRDQGFKQYGSTYSYIQGSATSWDPESRTVTITKPLGATQTLPYHALILATGTKSPSPFLTLQGDTHTTVQSALHEIRAQVHAASNIVIAGGGPTGVEAAGEIAEYLNGAPGWFRSAPAQPQKATITLLTNADKLLPALRPAIAQQAEAYLRRLGVTVHYNARVTSTSTTTSSRTPTGGPQTRVELADGTSLLTDLYIPAMGQTPMTDYVPRALLDERGYVVANARTTRVEAAGPRVYAIGDVAAYSRKAIPDIMEAVPVLQTNLRRDLLAAHHDLGARPVGPDREFVPNEKELQLVVIGRSKGVGAVFGWRVPSWFVWVIKGRDYMVSKAMDLVMGKMMEKESVWKVESA